MARFVPIIAASLLLLFGTGLPAEETEAKPAEKPTPVAAKPADAAQVDLAAEQAQVVKKFGHLKEVLMHMAELTAATDPRRAALLRQAVAQSNEEAIDNQLERLVDLLKKDLYAPALKDQAEVHQDLVRLLDLLLSENRTNRIKSEKERLREYLKRISKIIREQKALQSQTAGDGNPKKLAAPQDQLAQKTSELARDILDNEGRGAPPDANAKSEGKGKPQDKDPKSPKSQGKPGKNDGKADGKSGGKDSSKGDNKADDKAQDGKADGKADDKAKDDKAQDDAKPDQGKSEKAQGKPDSKSKGEAKGQGEGKPKPGKGQPGGEEGEQSPGDDDDQSKQDDASSNPAQKRLKQAEKRMREARLKLEEAKRRDAADKQEEALRELEQAKAELEEILRQLREEEMGRMLAMLEARFRKMLDMQVQVYEGTKRVDKVPEADRDRDDEIEAGRLSRKEAEILGEADRALALLREEGTAVAMPEAVSELRDDMEQVVVRLAQSKVGSVTQGIEEDIIAALEEMIAALQKAQKDLEQKMKSGPMPGGEPIDPPLVDALAEIKMIRALQMRVNRRTQRYAEMTKTEQAEKPDLIQALARLAERQERIYRVTRDLVVGRNK